MIPVDENNAENPVMLEDLAVVPVPMIHGNHHTDGYVFTYSDSDGKMHSIAYLTDCNFISDESLERVKKSCFGGQIEHLVIDAIREKEHSSHCNFLQALAYAERIEAKHTWFTHITHDMSHVDIQKYIDNHLSAFPKLQEIVSSGGNVSPAYDGLVLEA